mmetsp:Transcript_9285/g.14296  ORF Transcript_9285/g.14296 Transcript_9285/m.14296 type:complete len:140 (+) Transcript_9285:232-651(+)
MIPAKMPAKIPALKEDTSTEGGFFGGLLDDLFGDTDNDIDPGFNFPIDNIVKPDVSFPCLPDEIVDALGLTKDDWPCDDSIEFPLLENITDTIPCPPGIFLEHWNVSVEELPCNPRTRISLCQPDATNSLFSTGILLGK